MEEAVRLSGKRTKTAAVEAALKEYVRLRRKELLLGLPGRVRLEENGSLGFALRRRGVTVPVTDCVIAAAAQSIGGCLLSLDTQFKELAHESSLILLPS